MPSKSYQIIILAAGDSYRFGSDKRLITLQPLLKTIFEALGHQTGNIFCVLKDSDCNNLDELVGDFRNNKKLSIVFNSHSALGMGSSLALASQHLTADAALIFLADMPYVKASTLKVLVSMLDADSIIAPTYKGKRGHPVLIGKAFFPDLKSLQGEDGAKNLLLKHFDKMVLVDVDDKGIVLDVDRPEDLQW